MASKPACSPAFQNGAQRSWAPSAAKSSKRWWQDLESLQAGPSLTEVLFFTSPSPLPTVRQVEDLVSRRSLGYSIRRYNSKILAMAAERPLETVHLYVIRGERKLQFYRQSDRSLRIADTTTLPDSPPTIRETYINLDRDSIVPLYAINGEPRTGYDIQINYWSGAMPIIYALKERKDAFRLQRMITGYRTREHFDRTLCSIVFRATGWPLRRDKELEGRGELQFWAPVEGRVPCGNPRLRQVVSSRSLPSAIPELPAMTRRMSVVTTHSDTRRNRQIVISTPPPEPILVAFVQGYDHYTMLKIEGEIYRIVGLKGWN